MHSELCASICSNNVKTGGKFLSSRVSWN